MNASRRARLLRAGVLTLVLGCLPSTPDAIAFGMDLCSFCRMQIDDKRFGAVLLTSKGRTMKFDSIDCLIEYAKREGLTRDAGSMWVSDFRNPGTMLRADTARFVNLGPGRTPMGRGWAAVASARDAAAIGVIDIGEIKRWNDLS
jgi:copper chaperone NosL